MRTRPALFGHGVRYPEVRQPIKFRRCPRQSTLRPPSHTHTHAHTNTRTHAHSRTHCSWHFEERHKVRPAVSALDLLGCTVLSSLVSPLAASNSRYVSARRQPPLQERSEDSARPGGQFDDQTCQTQHLCRGTGNSYDGLFRGHLGSLLLGTVSPGGLQEEGVEEEEEEEEEGEERIIPAQMKMQISWSIGPLSLLVSRSAPTFFSLRDRVQVVCALLTCDNLHL